MSDLIRDLYKQDDEVIQLIIVILNFVAEIMNEYLVVEYI